MKGMPLLLLTTVVFAVLSAVLFVFALNPDYRPAAPEPVAAAEELTIPFDIPLPESAAEENAEAAPETEAHSEVDGAASQAEPARP